MKKKKFPVFSLVILGLIILGCLFGKLLATGDPFYMNLTE
ncbi:MAG: ABC transporter permease, partial [Blautia coccoides]